MIRLGSRAGVELYRQVWDELPAGVRALFDHEPPDLFLADPLFAGLHHDEETADGRSYRRTAHVCWRRDATVDGRQTIVFPDVDERLREYGPATVRDVLVHELGHLVDEQLGFRHTPQPVTWYAHKNRAEAFAEAFTAYMRPADAHDFYGGLHSYDFDRLAADEATQTLFSSFSHSRNA